MVIEEPGLFRLTPVKDSGERFDLELIKVINKGKDNERQEFQNVAYGISLESAIRHIANYQINAKYDGTINLKTYLKEYRDIISNIKQICQEQI